MDFISDLSILDRQIILNWVAFYGNYFIGKINNKKNHQICALVFNCYQTLNQKFKKNL